MATSNQDREQHINEGLRKLEEFQRRRVQGSNVGHVAIQRPASTAAASREPVTTPVLVASPTPSSSAPVPTTPNAPNPIGNTPGSSASSVARTLEFTGKLQALLELLLGVQVGNGTRSPSALEELQRQCSELVRESAATESQRQSTQAKISSLEESYKQAHKTIDLLVGEKSRLKAALEALDFQLYAKTHEVEVYESEVRTLRGKVTTTEGQIESLRQEYERSQGSASNSSSNDALFAAYKKQLEDLGEQQRHSGEKLQQMHKAYEQVRTALESTTKELSVAQAYIQQLSGGFENPSTTAETTSNDELEALRDEIRTLMSEKSAAELISRNLEASNKGLQDRVAKLTHDFHQLQQMRNAHAPSPMISEASENAIGGASVSERTSIETQCELPSEFEVEKQRLETEKQNLVLQLEAAQRLAEQYQQELTCIQTQMAITGEQLQKAKLDSSRACVQNRDLKSQLEELQDVFVRLSNEKLDLTEQLDAEKHRALQLENELLRAESAPTSATPTPSATESSEIVRWVERYENLEKQHATCRETIEKLELKISTLSARPAEDLNSACNRESKAQNDSPSVSISEYEFVEQTSENSAVAPVERDSDTDNISNSSKDSTSKSRDIGIHTPVSKQELHTKFRDALQRIQTLEEQKNFLEHQVVQLQMETDTISDYVQLYQQQRAALNRRQQDKEAQMSQLLSDREELREKVGQLQALVARLVPSSFTEKLSETHSPLSDNTQESTGISKEILAREIFSTLEDINQASSPVSFDGFKCTSCHGCQGKLISL